ncbi:hypothetical protein EYZ11_012162 [Aspergillus tanneri]|uniref:Uncharacterized protein n=1 Tax=Aspergillus tanneri TaxID=1220188 RepID=A0A4V3UMR9_9EURO|nr:hypothetical protein EYZ11_012162 [Aspergillus tanneri]
MPTIVGSSPPDSGTWKKDLGGILRQAGGAEYKSTLDASSSTLNGAASINDPGNILKSPKERRNGAREVQLVQDAINEELSFKSQRKRHSQYLDNYRSENKQNQGSLAGDYNPKSPTVSPQGRKDYILETVELLSEKNTNIAFDPIRTSLRHYMAGGPASEISNRLSDCLFNHAGKSGRSWGVCGVNYSTSNYFYDVPYEHERGDQCDRRPSVS